MQQCLNILALIGSLWLTFSNVKARKEFEIIHEWKFINYTWPTVEKYKDAIKNQKYKPGSVHPSGIKVYGGKIFISMPRMTTLVPVTIGYILKNDKKKSPLFSPFPSWKLNTLDGDCNKLQSVQSFEIDTNGIAWILDGVRINRGITTCPTKLILIDTKTGRVVCEKVFPEEISLSVGGWLNDIVIDDTDGGFAYITDCSYLDPGLIVYSKSKDQLWKFRDPSMFAELNAPPFVSNGIPYPSDRLTPINGIALSPKSCKERFVYYCVVIGLNFYSISTTILKNATTVESAGWRRQVNLLGKRPGQSDGMGMDSAGMLYFGFLGLNAIGRWNSNKRFKINIIYQNNDSLIWADSFGFDNDDRAVYALSNSRLEFDEGPNPKPPKKPKVRLWRLPTGNRNYMY